MNARAATGAAEARLQCAPRASSRSFVGRTEAAAPVRTGGPGDGGLDHLGRRRRLPGGQGQPLLEPGEVVPETG